MVVVGGCRGCERGPWLACEQPPGARPRPRERSQAYRPPRRCGLTPCLTLAPTEFSRCGVDVRRWSVRSGGVQSDGDSNELIRPRDTRPQGARRGESRADDCAAAPPHRRSLGSHFCSARAGPGRRSSSSSPPSHLFPRARLVPPSTRQSSGSCGLASAASSMTSRLTRPRARTWWRS